MRTWGAVVSPAAREGASFAGASLGSSVLGSISGVSRLTAKDLSANLPKP